MTEPRWDLIEHIKQQIAAGTYATEAKLRCCIDGIMNDLTGKPKSHTLPRREEPRMDHEPQEFATEFHLAVVQMVIKFATASEGDEERLATMARAQVVCGEALRKLILRSQLLGKRWDAWTQEELLGLVQAAEKEDVTPGGGGQ